MRVFRRPTLSFFATAFHGVLILSRANSCGGVRYNARRGVCSTSSRGGLSSSSSSSSLEGSCYSRSSCPSYPCPMLHAVCVRGGALTADDDEAKAKIPKKKKKKKKKEKKKG